MDERFWLVHVSIAVIVSVDLALSVWKAWALFRLKKNMSTLGMSFEELCGAVNDLRSGKREKVLFEVRRIQKP